MRKLLILFILLNVTGLHAQTASSTVKGRDLSFYIYGGGQYNMHNANKLKNITYLTSQNTYGGKLGSDFMAIMRVGIFINTGFELNITPQKLDVRFSATDLGYNIPGKEFHREISYKMYTLGWKVLLGYSIPMDKSSAIDISTGVRTDITLGARKYAQTTAMYENLTAADNKDLVFVQEVSWGSYSQDKSKSNATGSTLLYDVQAACRLKKLHFIGKRDVRMGVDFTGLIMGNRVNRVVTTYYGPNRTKLNSDYFIDKHLSIGLFVGVQI